MSVSASNRILVITDNHRNIVPIRAALKTHELVIEENLNLHSAEMIRKILRNTKNTTFLRTELFKFIQAHGYPFFIAIDYRLDCGLPPELDPDQMKLLRTLLISFIILSRGKGFENLRGNFLILGKEDQMGEIQAIEQNPTTILEKINTRDEKVNSFITQMKEDRARFNRTFLIRSIAVETASDEVTRNVDNFIQAIKAREKLLTPPEEDTSQTQHDRGDYEAASVIYPIDEDKVYVNGEIILDMEGTYSSLDRGQFYIQGYWTNKTQLRVADKIIHAVKGNLNGKVTFSPDEEIPFVLGEDCIIDATTAASLAQITAKDLYEYPEIKIYTTDENRQKLENSTGFGMIQKIVEPLI
jgi:hypothetical protein